MPRAPQNMEVIAPTRKAKVVKKPFAESTQKNTIVDIKRIKTKQILY